MEVLAIDQRDLNRITRQRPRSHQPAKAGSDNHRRVDVFWSIVSTR